MHERTVSNSFKENILIAKGQVRHLTGGPIMSLIGFIHPVAYRNFLNIKGELTQEQVSHVAEKICINSEKKIGFYPGISATKFYGHIFNQNGKLMGWYSPNTFADSFKCLCRYYSKDDKTYLHQVFSPLEVEFID